MLRRGPEERTLYKHGYYYYSCDYRWGLGEPQTGSDLAEAGRDRGARLGSTSRGPPPGIVTKAAGTTPCPCGNASPTQGGLCSKPRQCPCVSCSSSGLIRKSDRILTFTAIYLHFKKPFALVSVMSLLIRESCSHHHWPFSRSPSQTWHFCRQNVSSQRLTRGECWQRAHVVLEEGRGGTQVLLELAQRILQ